MRIAGTILMGFGTFCVSVAMAAIVGPGLRALGIDVRAETTSVIGTALIGVFAFGTGVLLRRRATDTSMGRRALGATDASSVAAPLGAGAAEPLSVVRGTYTAEGTQDDG